MLVLSIVIFSKKYIKQIFEDSDYSIDLKGSVSEITCTGHNY